MPKSSLRPLLTAPFAALAILVAACLIGCGRPVPSGKVRVRGTVTYGGQPLQASTGMISCFATQGTNSNTAKIATDGSFTIDLEPGEYRVGVEATDGYDRLAEDSLKPIKAKSLIPENYANPTKSALSITAVANAKPVTIALEQGK